MLETLIKELKKYDALECPTCGRECKPDGIRVNGTIIYETHSCKAPYALMSKDAHFEIDVTGELVE